MAKPAKDEIETYRLVACLRDGRLLWGDHGPILVGDSCGHPTLGLGVIAALDGEMITLKVQGVPHRVPADELYRDIPCVRRLLDVSLGRNEADLHLGGRNGRDGR